MQVGRFSKVQVDPVADKKRKDIEKKAAAAAAMKAEEERRIREKEEAEAQARIARLNEILGGDMSLEDKVNTLVAEGYNDEAKALVDELAAEKTENIAKAAAEASVEAALASAGAKNESEQGAPEENQDKTAKTAKTPKAKAPAKAKAFNFDESKGKKSKK